MKKLSRVLLVVLGAVLGLAVLILISVNLYVQSQGTQARIQDELSQRLGTPLHVRRISVTPWTGLKLTGITIPQSQPGVPADFLTAKTFRLRIRFASLFARRLVIKEIALINPDVVWAQNAEGKWRLPSAPLDSAAKVVAPEKSEPPPVPAAPRPAESSPPPAREEHKEVQPPLPVDPPLPEPVVAQSETTKSTRFAPEVRRVNLVRGRFRFLDEKLKSLAFFDDVTFRSNFRTSTDVRGTISIAKTSLRDRFFLEELQSPLRYDATQLDFSQITARAGNGQIAGRFTIQPLTEDSPFAFKIQFNEVEADRIVANAGGGHGTVRGRLEGFLEASGKTSDPDALGGQGEIILRDGQVQQYSLLVALGQLLQIEELRQLHLDEAQIKFHLTPGIVTIDELVFRSKNIRLSATGTVSFEGKLQLESQLAVNEKMQSQVFAALRQNFQPTGEPGYSGLNFQVTGTVGRPKTNLMDKLIGKDLGSVINSLIGGGKSEKARRKKAAEEKAREAQQAASTPAESPPPEPAPAATETPSPSPTSAP